MNNQTTISVYDCIFIQIKPLDELFTDWDLLFKSECKLVNTYTYTSTVNHILISIEVWNSSDKAVIILYHTFLDYIIKYKADSCFLISLNILSQANLLKLTNWVKFTFYTLLAVSTAYYIVSNISVKSEHQLQNRITVYEQISTAVTALTDIINCYASLWEDKGNMTDISENKWIKISLLNNW